MINILCVFGIVQYLTSLTKQEALLLINSTISKQGPVSEKGQEYRTYRH